MRTYPVYVQSSRKIVCYVASCHILKVMMKTDISKIPRKYIIDRWRKEKNLI
jgi:hypothetical protein